MPTCEQLAILRTEHNKAYLVWHMDVMKGQTANLYPVVYRRDEETHHMQTTSLLVSQLCTCGCDLQIT